MRFCLVTSAHVCNNPRLVKEADALHAAGHDVRVVAVNQRRDLRERDAMLIQSRGWTLDRVNVDRRGGTSARLRWLRDAMAQKAAQRAFAAGLGSGRIRDRAVSRHVGALLARATAHPADVVVGHNVAALPVAAHAGRQLRARVGFDLEDLYSEVLPDEPQHRESRAIVRDVERVYLPQCDLLTASSSGIADEVSRRYGVPRPEVVLNCFDRVDPPVEPQHPGVPTLYWFSQVVGRGRGLEEVVRAVARLEVPAHLHLRGEVDSAFRRELGALIAECGVVGRVHFLPPAPMDDLVPLAATFDVGLATEPGFSINNLLAASNKLFTYLAAGTAVVASDTPGQTDALAGADDAARFYRRGDVDSLVRVLNQILASPSALAAAKNASRRWAHARFSWGHQAPSLVNYLTRADAKARPTAPKAGATPRAEVT